MPYGLTGFADDHAAPVKHSVITIKKMSGIAKRYIQHTTAMAAQHNTNAHTMTRMIANVSAGRRASCHANTAANR